jgi:hypothetical protein
MILLKRCTCRRPVAYFWRLRAPRAYLSRYHRSDHPIKSHRVQWEREFSPKSALLIVLETHLTHIGFNRSANLEPFWLSFLRDCP